MRNDWELRIERAVNHVRQHLREDLTIPVLAQVAHFSPFHFARVFKCVTGQTVSQYVRRARLERAAYLMQARPERELGEIALLTGFSATSDFSRVFKQHYGVAPSRWDRRTALVPRIHDYEDELQAARSAASPMQARIVQHAACRVATVRVATPFMDDALLEAGYRDLIGWFAARGIDWRHQTLLGLSWDHPEATPLEHIRFDLGFTLPEGIDAGRDITVVSFHALQAVEVHVSGPKAHIALAWEHLYDEWLPQSSAEPLDLPTVKRFRRRPDQLGWTEFDLDCSIAIAPHSGA